MFQTLKNLTTPILDFIYPPFCSACEQRLTDGDRIVCSKCWSSLPGIQPDDPVWIEIESRFRQETIVAGILSCFLFEKEGALQQIIHLLKYQGMKSLGVRLGKEIGNRIRASEVFSLADYLLPIPLHRLKQRERGYNQSEYICRGISETAGIPIDASLLYRTKYTKSQTQLNLEERRENVGDAFKVNPKFQNEIQGKSFILVDDVITTGSTITACARELSAHGAKKVLAATVALAK